MSNTPNTVYLQVQELTHTTDRNADTIYYFSVQSREMDDYTVTFTGKYRVTEDHHPARDGQVAIDFKVAAWTTTGWAEVLTYQSATPSDTVVAPTSASGAAKAVHRFLHHHTEESTR